jgi:FKBP-type peptidyl-prolyl cis-trans isomerase FkpA
VHRLSWRSHTALGRQIKIFDMSPQELAFVQAGMAASVLDQPPAVDSAVYGPRLPELAQERSTARAAVEKEKGQAFLEEQARAPGAVRTDSGLVFIPLSEGTGESPTATDIATVHYWGRLPDGKEFDSSYKRNEPAQFPLNGVIRCWTEGLQRMKVGGKARRVCLSELRQRPRIPVVRARRRQRPCRS